MGNLKIPIVITVFLISLTLLLLGQRFIFRPYSIGSLEARFAEINGVETARIESEPDGTSLLLQLREGTGLRHSYEEILKLSRQAGIQPERITIIDARGPVLSQALYAIHYSVAEGIATGQFRSMASAVEDELAHRDIVDYEIWVEEEFVYLEMHYGPEHLHQMFPREGYGKLRGSVS